MTRRRRLPLRAPAARSTGSGRPRRAAGRRRRLRPAPRWSRRQPWRLRRAAPRAAPPPRAGARRRARPTCPTCSPRARAELIALAPRGALRRPRSPADAGKFENLNALLAPHPAGRLRLAAGRRRRRRAAPRLPGRASSSWPSASACALAQPAHRWRSHAAWSRHPPPARAASCARPRSWRSARCRALRADDLRRRCCRSRRCAPAGAWTRTGRRSPAQRGWRAGGRSTPRRSGTGCAGSPAPTTATPRSPRPARSWPTARTSPPPRPSGRCADAPRAGDEGPGAGRVLPARRRPDVGHLGPSPDASPPATPGPSVRVLVLHRPLPPLSAAAPAGISRPRGAALRQPPTACARRRPRRLPALPLAAAAVELCAAGGRGRRRCCAGRCAGSRREFPFDLVHAHYAVPPATRSGGPRPAAPMVVSVHGGDVLGAHAGAPDGARRRWPTPGWCSPTAPGRRRRCVGARAPRERPGSCTSGTDVPAAAAAAAPRDAACWSPSAT